MRAQERAPEPEPERGAEPEQAWEPVRAPAQWRQLAQVRAPWRRAQVQEWVLVQAKGSPVPEPLPPAVALAEPRRRGWRVQEPRGAHL